MRLLVLSNCISVTVLQLHNSVQNQVSNLNAPSKCQLERLLHESESDTLQIQQVYKISPLRPTMTQKLSSMENKRMEHIVRLPLIRVNKLLGAMDAVGVRNNQKLLVLALLLGNQSRNKYHHKSKNNKSNKLSK